MRLFTSPALDELCSLLEGKTPNWEEIVRRVRETRWYKELSEEQRRLVAPKLGFRIRASEEHLRVALEEIAAERKLRIEPFRYDHPTADLFLSKRKGNWHAVRRNERTQISEYDELILLDGTPIAFEITTARWIIPKSYGKRSPIRRKMMAQFYEPKLQPLRTITGREPGMVLVVARDVHQSVMEEAKREGTESKKYLDAGGRVVSLYGERIEFYQQVREKFSA